MTEQFLHENWQMYRVGDTEKIPACVPGSVYQDLLDAGKMEDPYYRDNELKALSLMEDDYTYETEFVPDKEILDADRAILRFHGLDTLADIYLNEELLGSVNNMHRIWDYEVLDLLRPDHNSLKITFHSPTKFIREAYAEDPAEGTTDAMKGFPLLRKAHCMFGWDWGPRLPDAGIWRDVQLIGVNVALIDSVYITQDHADGKVTLNLEVELNCSDPSCAASDCAVDGKCGLTYEVMITAPDGTVKTYTDAPETILIEDPMLWWPNGYGEQNLYRVCVTLLQNGVTLDTWERRIGLRTMTMHIEKDEWGESFAHEVNGVQIFAMGADYIPEDNILSRVTYDRTKQLLTDCRDAHFNAIRVSSSLRQES